MHRASRSLAPSRRVCASRSTTYRGRKVLPWTRLSDLELLGLRFCDLGLTIEGSRLGAYMERLYGELENRGIDFQPHAWLAEEPFTRAGLYASTSVHAFQNLWPQKAGYPPAA